MIDRTIRPAITIDIKMPQQIRFLTFHQTSDVVFRLLMTFISNAFIQIA